MNVKQESIIETKAIGRIKWVDCAKAMAIMGVIMDHTNGLLYTNQAIAYASYFAVGVFILLAGIMAYKTTPVVRGGGCKYLKSLGHFLSQYAVATFVIQIWYTHFFDLRTYVSYLLNFSIQGPYYFLLFFLQLKLITPFLVMWCRFCDKQKIKYFWHFITIACLCWFCSILVYYTFILPVHGGGKNLFGGTFLLLYYIGILFGNFNVFDKLIEKKYFVLGISIILWIVWWRLYCLGKLPFDVWLSAYWGNGFNPPSINAMVFSIISLFVFYSAFCLFEDYGKQVGRCIVNILSFIGQYTLYIFMYHLLVRDIVLTLFPQVQSNIWLMRFAIFIPMLLAPVLIAWLIKKIRNKVYAVCLES